MAQLLQMTSLYGTLAKFYEHSDPEKHIYFYKKHVQYELQLVQMYWSLYGHSHSHGHGHGHGHGQQEESYSWDEHYQGYQDHQGYQGYQG
ncbi:hypothetical protein [Bhargavaea cecembensis]|uniref:hypothetical protein n=1 Tax=Bhargavaea cecembensis TaxID=394098 RepID=UPI0018D33D32|nr:hypothetical protein [Bhargavaea cecembensis]